VAFCGGSKAWREPAAPAMESTTPSNSWLELQATELQASYIEGISVPSQNGGNSLFPLNSGRVVEDKRTSQVHMPKIAPPEPRGDGKIMFAPPARLGVFFQCRFSPRLFCICLSTKEIIAPQGEEIDEDEDAVCRFFDSSPVDVLRCAQFRFVHALGVSVRFQTI
jgi:hypothetical protein